MFRKEKTLLSGPKTGSFMGFAILVNAALMLHKNYISPEIHLPKYDDLPFFKEKDAITKVKISPSKRDIWKVVQTSNDCGGDTFKEEMSTINKYHLN